MQSYLSPVQEYLKNIIIFLTKIFSAQSQDQKNYDQIMKLQKTESEIKPSLHKKIRIMRIF